MHNFAILQRKNTECNEKSIELETEKNYYNDLRVYCEEQEQNHTQVTVYSSNTTTNICEELRRNYTQLVNKYILLTKEKDENNKKYYDLDKNHTILQYKYDVLINDANHINATEL